MKTEAPDFSHFSEQFIYHNGLVTIGMLCLLSLSPHPPSPSEITIETLLSVVFPEPHLKKTQLLKLIK